MLSIRKPSANSRISPRNGYRYINSIVPDFAVSMKMPTNEPILGYLKDSRERGELMRALEKAQSKVEDIPIVIGDKECRTEQVKYQVMPHNHGHKLAKFYLATPELIKKAIEVATATQKWWDDVPIAERIKIWDRAADKMSQDGRQILNAATMLGQSKTVFQAEIDAAAELIDFFRFHAYFLTLAMDYKPLSPTPKLYRNFFRYRGVDGFMAAITPFNFTAIGGNLAFTPALIGNAVLWKPSSTAVLSNWEIFKICRQAGVPPGVVNFVPSAGKTFGKAISESPNLAGINFTGSVPTFNWLWKAMAQNIDKFVNYPKMIGECGGKNYHFVHPSADVESVINHTIRSAFEYSGQKCSACSRMYVPESLWCQIKEGLVSKQKTLKVDDPEKFDTFTSAVIDKPSFDNIKTYIEYGKCCKDVQLIVGGKCDDSKGYFVEPTIFLSCDPYNKLMVEEIFGPVLTIFVYEDKYMANAIELVASSTRYALTGAIFAKDENFLRCALKAFKITAGNFYINDKSTGSVVGQQAFGGARMSGTNDKAGGPNYVLRFGNPQTIKETYIPQKEIGYPYMLEP